MTPDRPAGTVFLDRTGRDPVPLEDFWEPVIVPKEAIDAEVVRLAALPRPANGRRRSLLVHPRHTGAGPGLAPGIQVALEVLRPGEETRPTRHNSSQVVFCIAGRGTATVLGRKRAFERHDVWNTPSMAAYQHRNDGDELQVRLTYSNAALLEKLGIHYVVDDPDEAAADATDATGGGTEPGRVTDRLVPDDTADDMADQTDGHPVPDTFPLAGADNGELLMSYERLINPRAVESRALLWRWTQVREELVKLHSLGAQYRGRRLYLLYNSATGRTNGTTHSFFATMCLRPAGIVDRPHRHSAAAINYYFSGSGHSVVEGTTVQWKAGDLMLSAPGWAVHNHVSHDEDVFELTIQDSPFNLANDSLLWQEQLRRPPILLGSHSGWQTNRARVAR